jgi:hypothetical protein
LLGLLSENRENIDQNDIHRLIDEMNMITASETKYIPEKKVTMGTTNYDMKSNSNCVNLSILGTQQQTYQQTYQQQTGLMTPPTRETKNQATIGTAPNWFNKLKDNLRK